METRHDQPPLPVHFDIHTTLIIDDTLVEFLFFGRVDQVKMLVRELFYHYTGDFLFGDVFHYTEAKCLSGAADCKQVNTIMNQRFVEYTVSVSLSNMHNIARVLWCIGKATGAFLSGSQLIQNARDNVRNYPDASSGGLRGAINTLESCGALALSKQAIPFEFKYDSFKVLQAHDITKSFWTEAEKAQEQLEQQNTAEEMLALSYKGWSLRLFHTVPADKSKQQAKYCPSCTIL